MALSAFSAVTWLVHVLLFYVPTGGEVSATLFNISFYAMELVVFGLILSGLSWLHMQRRWTAAH